MDKEYVIEEMSQFFSDLYFNAVNDINEDLEEKLQIEKINFIVSGTDTDWIKAYNIIHKLNKRVCEIAKKDKDLYLDCIILNRKLTMILDGMEKVLIKDFNVTGFTYDANNKRFVLVY